MPQSTLLRFSNTIFFALFGAPIAVPAAQEDLAGYRGPASAMTVIVAKPAVREVGAVAYLGVHVKRDTGAGVLIEGVDPVSPAAGAGLQPGDVILEADGKALADEAAFREWLRACVPAQSVGLQLRREGASSSITVALEAVSRPLKTSNERVYLGINHGEPGDLGAVVENVSKDSPAAKAGVRQGDLLARLDDVPVSTAATLSDLLTEKRPGDLLALSVLREGASLSLTAKLGVSSSGLLPLSAVLPSIWRRDEFKLAVIGVEFPDTKMNPVINRAAWEEAFFSEQTYRNKKSATGQQVHGSLADFYRENSCGKLRVSGSVFDPVCVAKTRAEWAAAARETEQAAFCNEALDRFLEREGADALKGFDGLIFIYAGERYPKVNRNTLFWPHRASFSRAGKKWSYFICPEGGKTMVSISVFCHEFGHMLGLPDLYARPENPGSEGLGVWCLMSNERGAGKPQQMSAWCKAQLGWLAPAVIDPRVPQKLVLGPVEGSAGEAFKVLLRPDGAEYLLLENRRRIGFDESLPSEGLLIWRVVGRRPMLEESHGVEGPSGPRVFLGSIPYPSRSNTAFTPFTTPSSRPQLGGGYPVHITNIRQHPDGRVSFLIGYEYD
jgi:M6 family metalloprotease-like protein